VRLREILSRSSAQQAARSKAFPVVDDASYPYL
jgi:hypothetical protein